MLNAPTAWYRSMAPWQWGLLAVLSAFLCTRGLDGGDLEIFLQASVRMFRGEPVYGQWLPRHDGASLQYYYGPLFAWITWPLTALPLAVAVVIWQVLRLAALVRTWHLLRSEYGPASADQRERRWVLIGCVLLIGRALLLDQDMVQVTVFLVWACVEGITGLREGKRWPAALLLALSIAVKLLPVVLLPYLLFRGRWRDLISIGVCLLCIFLMPAMWMGWSADLAVHQAWLNSLNPFSGEHAVEASLGIHGLSAVIPAYLTDLPDGVDMRRHVAQLDPATVHVVIQVVRAIFVLSVLAFMKRPFFSGAKSRWRDLGEVSYIMLLVPLLFPHQQKYAFVLLLPAAYWLIQTWYRDRSRTLFALLLIAALLLTFTSDLFIGFAGSRIAQHYKLMSFGAMFLGAAMWVARGRSTPEEDLT